MANSYSLTKGSTVEVRCEEVGLEGAWYVATILDQLLTTKLHTNHKKKKVSYLIKYHTLFFKQHDHDDDDLLLPLTDVVDPSFIRPSPPPNEDNNNISKEFEVGDVVDAYHRDGWWIGVVKTVIINQPQLNNYIVSFEDQELMFEKSNLRFHVDWVDSRWIIPPKQTLKQLAAGDGIATDNNVLSVAQMTEEALLPSSSAKIKAVSRKRSKSDSAAKTSRAKRIQPSPGGKGNTKVTVSVMETSRSDDIHQSSPPETIITTCELKDGMGHRNRKKGRPPKLVVEKPVGLLQGSSCFSPPDHNGNSLSQASAGTTSDYQQDWPFIKRFPIWDTIELYSQKPHFSPLKTRKEEFREGLAIGYMVTFWNLAQRLSDLQLNDPADELNNILETLCDLEIHGFDVGPIRTRLNDLLTLKSKVSQHEDTRKKVEKELQKCKHEKSQMEKEIDQYKTKTRVLKLKTKRAATLWKRKDGEVTRLRSKRILICNQISDWKLAFGELAA
ncbi:hypothetical protein M8C21_012365, partial [Ambrosia artemisiifolia]